MEQYQRQKDMIQRKYVGTTVGDQVKVTDYEDTQYFCDIEIGTPGQSFTVIPDTGSSNVWVYGSGCKSVICSYHDTYDSSASSTYVEDGSAFDISYGSGSVDGFVSKDKVAFDSEVFAEQMSFGEINEVKGVSFYASQMSGILGLAYTSISVNNLPTFLDESNLSEKTFSMCLKHTDGDSYITLPGYFEGTTASDYNFHPVVEEKYYSIQFDSAKQAGGDLIDSDGYKAVIDSGTSLLVGPKSLVDKITDGIKVNTFCKGIEDLPDITFTFAGIEYTLTYEDYVIQVEQNGITECLLGIEGSNFGPFFKYFIFGDVFMRKFPTYFDQENNQVGFTTSC